MRFFACHSASLDATGKGLSVAVATGLQGFYRLSGIIAGMPFRDDIKVNTYKGELMKIT